MNLEDALGQEPRVITAINFNLDGLEISFLEKDEQGEHFSLGHVAAIEIDDHDEEMIILYTQLQSTASDMVDRGYISKRNPPTRIVGDREEFARPKEEDEDESN